MLNVQCSMLNVFQNQPPHPGPLPRFAAEREKFVVFVRPDDVAVDDEHRFVTQQRQCLFQSAAGFERLGFLGQSDGQVFPRGQPGASVAP